ncbi:hypothetical protein BT96DRAFT_996554 [Gymnopus androsaceus JB14]|uniref:Uncharacterized protein n=1 Tax=Gymnopus androsaceus JB14 TaxID=1447944 RepID=A0A6A4HGC7_9AGAR|nr:hypothetical protein BT96DRAFT_996554 [Gymnopus androsaceus JB14]
MFGYTIINSNFRLDNKNPNRFLTHFQPLSVVEDSLKKYWEKYVSDSVPNFHPAAEEEAPTPFSREAMVDAIMYHIIADDESIEVIKSAFFRRLIRTLQNELKDFDIPYADSMHACIMESLDQYLDKLREEIVETAKGDVSFTDDRWTDQKQHSFMAITGH